jgi:hypothetical protein
LLLSCSAMLVACAAVGHRKPADGVDSGVDTTTPPPDVPPLPTPKDCREAMQQGKLTDGVVTIDPDGEGGNPAFDVYCNMTTAGGGWTLVWSYGFTNYNNFTANNNAITPRPNWTYQSGSGTPVSTTIPTDPAMHGAMDFATWQNFGSELLVTSTINHWVDCVPGTGSLVTHTSGSLSCTVVKVVANKCTSTAPNQLVSSQEGPALVLGGSGNFYYYFDGSQNNNWPTHDPCGQNQTNQLNGVSDPGGAVYVRRP